MNTFSYKTISANAGTVDKKWLVIDAADKPLGRLMSRVATLVRGKHKPNFTPHVDCGDNVIIINAKLVKLSGMKWDDRAYLSHTGFPGGQRSITPRELLAKNPRAILEKSLKGMLPKNRLGRAIFHNVHIYDGSEHPHEAQKPEMIQLL